MENMVKQNRLKRHITNFKRMQEVLLIIAIMCTVIRYNDNNRLQNHDKIFTACSELQKVLFLAPSVCGFFVYEISPEPTNGLH